MVELFSSEEIDPVQIICAFSHAVEEGRDVRVLRFGELLAGLWRLFGFFHPSFIRR
jgi:hypothetical protein